MGWKDETVCQYSAVRFLGASSRETSLSNTALANGSSQSARMQDGECERQGQGAHFGSRRKEGREESPTSVTAFFWAELRSQREKKN